MMLSWRCISSGQPLPRCVNIAKPRVDRRPQFVERRVAVAGRDADALVGQHSRDGQLRIAFGRERDDPGEAAGGFEQTIHDIGRSLLRGVRRMGTDVARLLVEERPFDVNALNHTFDRRAQLAGLDDVLEPSAHLLEVGRDHGRQDPVHAVNFECFAGDGQRLGVEHVAIEINAEITVDLQIKEALARGHARQHKAARSRGGRSQESGDTRCFGAPGFAGNAEGSGGSRAVRRIFA